MQLVRFRCDEGYDTKDEVLEEGIREGTETAEHDKKDGDDAFEFRHFEEETEAEYVEDA